MGNIRQKLRYRGRRTDILSRDHKIANKHSGKIMTAKEILKLFGYSDYTYIHDTTVKHIGLIEEVGKNQFKVVNPDAK